MSFDFNELEFEEDDIDLSLFASNSEHMININRCPDTEYMDEKSAYAMLREMFSLQGRIESICEPRNERTLTVGSTDNILLDDDLEKVIRSGISDYAGGMSEHIFTVDSGTLTYNITFEKKYKGEDIYLMDADWKADISAPLLVFTRAIWVMLGGTPVLSRLQVSPSDMHNGAFIFQGVYRYVKCDLFGRKYWERISNSITIRKRYEEIYEFKEIKQ